MHPHSYRARTPGPFSRISSRARRHSSWVWGDSTKYRSMASSFLSLSQGTLTGQHVDPPNKIHPRKSWIPPRDIFLTVIPSSNNMILRACRHREEVQGTIFGTGRGVTELNFSDRP